MVTPEIIDPITTQEVPQAPQQVVPTLYKEPFDQYMQKKVGRDMNKNQDK